MDIEFTHLHMFNNNWDLWFQLKNKKSKFYLGEIPIDLSLTQPLWIDKYLGYLNNPTPPTLSKYIEDGGGPSLESHKYQNEAEFYPKVVWLTHDYLNNNHQFKNPIGAIYNPKYKKFDIHPGVIRNHILKIFPPLSKTVKSTIFNLDSTLPPEVKIIKEFKSAEEVISHFSPIGLRSYFTADRGCLVPHIHFDQPTHDEFMSGMNYHISKFSEYVSEYLKHFYFEFEQIPPNYSPDTSKLPVKIISKKGLNNLDKVQNKIYGFGSHWINTFYIKAVTLAPLVDNYEDEDMIITTPKTTFSRPEWLKIIKTSK